MARFRDPPDPLFQRLNASIGFDRRLAPYDVEQSRAHARALRAAGVLDPDEHLALLHVGVLEDVLDRVDRALHFERLQDFLTHKLGPGLT